MFTNQTLTVAPQDNGAGQYICRMTDALRPFGTPKYSPTVKVRQLANLLLSDKPFTVADRHSIALHAAREAASIVSKRTDRRNIRRLDRFMARRHAS